MREILFRGKRVDNGEWVEGCNINTQFNIDGRKHTYIGVHHESKLYPLMKSIGWFEIIPETVSQFTGLTDKNGKKIFEGDILKDCCGETGVVTYGVKNYGCFYDVFGFAVCDKDGDPLDYMCSSYNEVISNIFDNPELLENK